MQPLHLLLAASCATAFTAPRAAAARRAVSTRAAKFTIADTSGPVQNVTATTPQKIAIPRAVIKLHGAFKVHFLCAQRGAGVLLNLSEILAHFESGLTRGWLPHRRSRRPRTRRAYPSA